MIAVESKTLSKRYMYHGEDMSFSELDAPGIIITRLTRADFSHLETCGDKVDIVIIERGKKRSTMRFSKGTFDQFQIVLRDSSNLDIDSLDEHIMLDTNLAVAFGSSLGPI